MSVPPAPEWVVRTRGRLPWSDGSVGYVAVAPGSPVAMHRALALLESTGWWVHRVGRAFHAHGPNGSRLIGGWTDAGPVPAWWDRLSGRVARTVRPEPGAYGPESGRLPGESAPGFGVRRSDAPVASEPLPVDSRSGSGGACA